MDKDVSTGTIDPNLRPMVQAISEQNPTNQKKKAIITGAIIACVVALVGITVAVVLAISSKKPDPLNMAFQKLFERGEVRNIKAEGDIDYTITDPTSSVTAINLGIDARFIGASSTGNIMITSEIRLNGGQTLNPSFEVISTEGEDIYYKPGGLALALATLAGDYYESIPKNHPILTLINKIDNQWLATSSDEMKELLGSGEGGTGQIDEKSIVCVENLTADLGQNTYRLIDLYKKHPFIGATQKGLAISQKSNPLYRITIDKNNLIAFLEEFKNTEPMANFLKCTGARQFPINSEIVDTALSILPDFYLEISDSYDITRTYFDFALDSANFELVADFDFSYPDVINIAEPTEYINLNEVYEEFMSGMSTILQETQN